MFNPFIQFIRFLQLSRLARIKAQARSRREEREREEANRFAEKTRRTELLTEQFEEWVVGPQGPDPRVEMSLIQNALRQGTIFFEFFL